MFIVTVLAAVMMASSSSLAYSSVPLTVLSPSGGMSSLSMTTDQNSGGSSKISPLDSHHKASLTFDTAPPEHIHAFFSSSAESLTSVPLTRDSDTVHLNLNKVCLPDGQYRLHLAIPDGAYILNAGPFTWTDSCANPLILPIIHHQFMAETVPSHPLLSAVAIMLMAVSWIVAVRAWWTASLALPKQVTFLKFMLVCCVAAFFTLVLVYWTVLNLLETLPILALFILGGSPIIFFGIKEHAG